MHQKQTTKFLIYLFCTCFLFLQFSCKDSSSPNQKIDTQEIDSLVRKGLGYLQNQEFEKAVVILDSILNLDPDEVNKGYCFNGLGVAYEQRDSFPEATKYYLHAANVFETIKDTVSLAFANINLGRCFMKIGMYEKAVEHCLRSEKRWSKNGFKLERSMLYNTLANAHNELNNYVLAKKYYIKARELSPSFLPPINNLGNLCYKKQHYDSALLFYKVYKDSAIAHGDQEKVGRAYTNIAKALMGMQQDLTVMTLLDSAYSIYSKIPFKDGIRSIHQSKAEYFFNKNNFVKAAFEASTALQMSEKLNSKGGKLQVYHRLSLIFEKKKDFKQAFYFTKLHRNLKDTLAGVEQIRKVYTYEILTKEELKRKQVQQLIWEKEISETKREKTLLKLYLFIVGCLLLLLGLLYYLRRYREKKKFIDEYYVSDTGFILKTGDKILFDEIKRIETIRNDLVIIKTNGNRITEKSTTLKSVIPHLPKIQFGRPQRGIIINFKLVTKTWKTKIDLLDESINITPLYQQEFHLQWEEFERARRIK